MTTIVLYGLRESLRRKMFAVVLVLTLLIVLIVLSATWHLALAVFALIVANQIDPANQEVFQAVFGMIFTVIIALEFKKSLLIVAERKGSVVQIHPGPVVTTYELKPDAGVKYSKVTGLSDDLCLAMQAESVLIDRIPGKSTVGIQIPNRTREQISLRIGTGRATAQVADAGVMVRDLTGVVADAVRDQSIDHAPLVIFVLAATVLVLFMLRT